MCPNCSKKILEAYLFPPIFLCTHRLRECVDVSLCWYASDPSTHLVSKQSLK